MLTFSSDNIAYFNFYFFLFFIFVYLFVNFSSAVNLFVSHCGEINFLHERTF